MGSRDLLTPVLGLLLIVNYVTAIQWDYYFGKKESNSFQCYEKEGTIQIFSYRNFYQIPEPQDAEISYVRVTVWALSPPKVDYDWDTQTVSIIYSFMQITYSTFKIHAEALPILPSDKTVQGGESSQSHEVKS
ncbi:uncharacterized protein LOC125232861 [Leguminivora glycinivorella]|uniref:uncharacterized protein LOC125232861 n=1 Tax=Leguminivora glycinivorella TaxID=1035111 RepID=UPI00200D75C3|nr:uncharacterized protein LOC125232861 [Leguminivora glycinivorella]